MSDDKFMKMSLAVVRLKEIFEQFLSPESDRDKLNLQINAVVEDLGKQGFTKEEIQGLGDVATGVRSDLPGIEGSAVIITRK